MNLDGGGSTSMVVRNKVANRPSDATGPRHVCSGLLVVSTAPDGPPVHLYVTPDDKNITVGSSVKLSVSAADEFYNPVKVDEPVSWNVTGEFGSFDKEKRLFTAGNKGGEVFFEVKSGNIQASTSVMIKVPARLEVSPSPLILEPGENAALSVKAFDKDNNRLTLRQGLISYKIHEGDIGSLNGFQFTAGSQKGAGTISVSFGEIEETVPVLIGESATITYEDFENLDDWTLSIRMGGDKGSFGITDEDPRQGKHAGIIEYDMEKVSGVSAFYMAPRNPDISGTPDKVKLWLKWNGSDTMFRGTLKDADGDKWFLDFNATIKLDWKDEWREIEYPFDKVLKHWDNKTSKEIPAFPVSLQNFYLAQPITQKKDKGTIYIDDLRIVYRYGQQSKQ
jgi:phosphodiester glycosidase